ncbi:MAG: radical SAM protein [Bacteroides sp.]|nr:radical SAM protein [Bacteroides sp.]
MDHLNDANPVERRLVEKATQAGVPITANMELTPVCNLHCDMCFIRMEQEAVKRMGGLRTLDEWTDTARQLKEMGTLFILLTGGEPMMYPHFKELYTTLREMGFILTINTNGTLIDKETAELFRRLKPRRVNVTLYGTSNETYGRLCHMPNGFDRCIRGIEYLKANGIDTKMNLSIVRENEDELDALLDMADRYGIPAEVNTYMFPCVRSTCQPPRDIHAQRLDPVKAGIAEMEYLKRTKGNLYTEYRKQIVAQLAIGSPHYPGAALECRAAKSSCWLDWRGRMTPCCVMEEPAVALKDNTVAEAWRTIKEQGAKLPLHTECKGCGLRSVCNICYAAATHEKKVCDNLHYLCRMAKAKKEVLTHETN